LQRLLDERIQLGHGSRDTFRSCIAGRSSPRCRGADREGRKHEDNRGGQADQRSVAWHYVVSSTFETVHGGALSCWAWNTGYLAPGGGSSGARRAPIWAKMSGAALKYL
jgi:hypothetical protein